MSTGGSQTVASAPAGPRYRRNWRCRRSARSRTSHASTHIQPYCRSLLIYPSRPQGPHPGVEMWPDGGKSSYWGRCVEAAACDMVGSMLALTSAELDALRLSLEIALRSV